MSEVKFVAAPSKGGTAKEKKVAKMMDVLRKEDGPVALGQGKDDKGTLCGIAGEAYPQDVQAAFIALEMAGIVTRHEFTVEGSTRSRVAYSWNKEAGTDRPSRAASSGSKKSSSRSRSSSKGRQTAAA